MSALWGRADVLTPPSLCPLMTPKPTQRALHIWGSFSQAHGSQRSGRWNMFDFAAGLFKPRLDYTSECGK
jgi:hypothetical protein